VWACCASRAAEENPGGFDIGPSRRRARTRLGRFFDDESGGTQCVRLVRPELEVIEPFHKIRAGLVAHPLGETPRPHIPQQKYRDVSTE